MKIQTAITQKLEQHFSPAHLEVVNESHMHSVPPGSESHFKVVLVSENFAGLRQVPRHQQVYKVLADEMAGEVHALALHTYSPEEWQATGMAPDSPQCLGGSKADQ
ncbi:BolA/IbaG family iron-sulfur metabolism protein [Aestuariicella sp. G3-2]|uniref:BolA family protein n=1 Tax=Pseudomaricurvus albidus TaxID=2842452 RepID=UPI001C0C8194|nr:BolA/IbaG family iron-sulfur metabolism protein [Aestuariicella albida]MBU3071469.1 BolA/IbaG family iron-sulfur metabolism protein [Aestuariicella albida]